MSASIVEDLFTTASGVGTFATATVPSPTGGPVLAGDWIVYALFHCEAEENLTTADRDVDKSWVLEAQVGGLPRSLPGFEVYAELAGGGEQGVTRTFNFTVSAGWSVHTFIARGLDSATPLDVAPVVAQGTSEGNPDAPSISPVTADCLSVVVGVQDSTGATTLNSHPSGYTGLGFVSNTGAGVRAANSMVAYRSLTGAGSEHPGPWDLSVARNWAAATLALRPLVP